MRLFASILIVGALSPILHCIDPVGVSEFHAENRAARPIHVTFTTRSDEKKTVTVNPHSSALLHTDTAIPRPPLYNSSFKDFSAHYSSGSGFMSYPGGMKLWERSVESCGPVPGGTKCLYTVIFTGD